MPANNLRGCGLAALVLTLVSLGCGRGIHGILLPNEPPVVHITRTSRETATDGTLAYRIFWQGEDPDGRVDHYVFAIDPPSLDSLMGDWTVIRGTDYQVSAGPSTSSHQPHVFAVRAVDAQGAVSAPAWFAYSSDNLPPTVQIVAPRPSTILTPIVPPTVTIHWQGSDPDGPGGKPVQYKFRLFTDHNPDYPAIPNFIAFALGHPDSLRKLYAPGFAGWDSLPGDSTSRTYTGLALNQLYLFVITAIDQAGDYDPVFSGTENMLSFAVASFCGLGPQLCFFNSSVDGCIPSTCEDNPLLYLRIEIPASQLFTVNWSARPVPGAVVTGYRWVLDPSDLTDETPRSGDQDVHHWTPWSLSTTFATVGPFTGAPGEHRLYVEAVDDRGALSLGAVSMTAVQAMFDKDLLFVDDTRLTPDGMTFGVVDPPSGPWPTAAELDTFLFARGGFPWRGYPAGTLSGTGIFDGYDYDTLGTRALQTGEVPLALLSRYRTVVWMVDDIGASYTGNPTDLLQPTTALRSMSGPGHDNALGTYLREGGRLWLMGGGAALASLAPWNRRNTPPDEFDNTPDQELVAGRLMYDFAHWRSALMIRPAVYAILNGPNPVVRPPWGDTGQLGRGWHNHGMDHTLQQPDYAKLTANLPLMAPRTCATDPPSPLRDCGSVYVIRSYSAELMGTLASATPNFIQEDADPDPNVVREESTLDSLFFTAGGTAPPGRPVMTYYHGFESPQMVFSGFPLWYFQRTQATTLGQFVLSDIFGLARAPTARAAKLGASAAPAARPLRRLPMTRP